MPWEITPKALLTSTCTKSLADDIHSSPRTYPAGDAIIEGYENTLLHGLSRHRGYLLTSSSTQQLGFREWNKCATAPSCEEESGERFRAVLQHGASAGHCPQHRALPAAPCTACSTEHYPQHRAFPAAPFSTCSTAHGSPCSARSAMNCVLLCVHCVPPMPCTACSAMHGPHAVLPAAACTAQGRLQRAERCSLCSCPHCRHAAALERSCSGRTKGQFPPTPALCSELISPLPISTFSA